MALLEPKTVTITTSGGKSKDFVISKFPAIQGREIISKYPATVAASIPKIGDYAMSEDTMMKVMAFCAVELSPGNHVPLQTMDLINQHCGDWETLVRLEFAALRYNCDFFGSGSSFDFFETIGPKLQPWISKILTDFLPQLLPTEKQP